MKHAPNTRLGGTGSRQCRFAGPAVRAGGTAGAVTSVLLLFGCGDRGAPVSPMTGDVDGNATVAFTLDASEVSESVGAVTLSVRLAAPGSIDLTVPISFAGTATQGVDYAAADTATTILAGLTEAAVTFSIADDAFHEVAETIIVALSAPPGAALGSPSVQTVTIVDDDSEPAVSFAAAAPSVGEDAGQIALGVVLSAMSETETTVRYTVSGTAAGDGVDYTLANSVVDPAEVGLSFEIRDTVGPARMRAKLLVNSCLGIKSPSRFENQDVWIRWVNAEHNDYNLTAGANAKGPRTSSRPGKRRLGCSA
ncbi:MAG: hypothetical protein HY903_07790 [Deltaproteobacteria bacterium]|nr:hypothetical protein [Deltaproteobacteria bacterium]